MARRGLIAVVTVILVVPVAADRPRTP